MGRMKPRMYTDEEVVAALDEYGSSTGEVEEALGCTKITALRRLHQLADEDSITRKQIAHGYIWYPKPTHGVSY